MRTLRIAAALLLAWLAGPSVPAQAEERIDYEVNARIRKEGRERSQIMRTLHVLTDVYGPRLTGSPNHKGAAEWALKQMRDWGLENARLEPWEFGHPGWLNERFSGHILSPVRDALVGEVLAWTPSTNGAVAGKAVRIEPPRCRPGENNRESCPTSEELTLYLESAREKVKRPSAISAAIEEQGAATSEISSNTHRAAAGTTEVAGTMAKVNEGATQTGAASAQLLSSAQQLADATTSLQSDIDEFLKSLASAA